VQAAEAVEPGHGARKALSFKLVYAGFFGLLLCGVLVVVVIYLGYIRADRVAARHLPPDVTVAVRVDVEQAVLYEPVRKQLLPLANESFGLEATHSGLTSRLRRIHKHTGIELAVDMREIVVGYGPAPGDWVMVIGGRFPKRGVVSGVGAALEEEGSGWRISPDRQTLSAPSGVCLGQAADGAVVMASSPSRLAAALPSHEYHREIGLAPEGPGGFAARGALLRELRGSAKSADSRGWGVLENVERVTGTLALGPTVDIEAYVDLTPGTDSEAARAGLEQALRALRDAVAGSDRAGERQLLERAELTSAGPGRVRLRTRWERSEVDRGAHSLALAIRNWASAR
jgi:hypothetical protein